MINRYSERKIKQYQLMSFLLQNTKRVQQWGGITEMHFITRSFKRQASVVLIPSLKKICYNDG